MKELKRKLIVRVLGNFNGLKDFGDFIYSLSLLLFCSMISIVSVGLAVTLMSLLPVNDLGLPIAILVVGGLTVIGYIICEILLTVYLYYNKAFFERFNLQLKRLQSLFRISLMIVSFVVLLFAVSIEVEEVISKTNYYYLLILWILLLPNISVIRRNS